MQPETLKNTIEALLMASDRPLSVDALVRLLASDVTPPTAGEIQEALHELAENYHQRTLEVREVASGYRIQIREDYSVFVQRLFAERPPRYSRSFLEILAIIVYQQPVTRAEIEEIRGVAVNTGVIKALRGRGWIKVVGHKSLPGKPELLATTKDFLDYFNLKELADLPAIDSNSNLPRTTNQDLFVTPPDVVSQKN